MTKELKIHITLGDASITLTKQVTIEGVTLMTELLTHLEKEGKWIIFMKECEKLAKDNHDVNASK